MAQQCPSSQILSEWLVGKLDNETAESVAEHVSDCSRCELTADGLESHLTMTLRGLEQYVHGDEFASEEALARVIKNVAQIMQSEPRRSDRKPRVSPPVRIRQYEIGPLLGAGGMGDVFVGHHAELDQKVAIKLLPPDQMESGQAVERFEREWRALGSLKHPNVVRAMDAGEDDGFYFLVMEHIAGADVGRISAALEVMRIADACEVVRQASLGLMYAHEQGLIHRDIKPSNLMIDQDGTIKILDLGLATFAKSVQDGELTKSGQLMGSIDYMAPEQGRDTRSVDTRADVFSLGATLYKLLTGRALYGDKNTMVEKLTALAIDPIPSIGRYRTNVPAELNVVIERMLEKKAEDRYQTLGEVAVAVEPFCVGADLKSLANRYQDTSIRDRTTIDEVGLATRTDRGEDDSQSSKQSSSGSTTSSRLPRVSAIGLGRKLALGIGCVVALGVLLAMLPIIFKNEDATFKVMITDPEVVVHFESVQLTQADSGKEFTVRPGRYAMDFSRRGRGYEAYQFELQESESVRLQVSYSDNGIQVKRRGKLTLMAKELPRPPTPRRSIILESGVSAKQGTWLRGPDTDVLVRGLVPRPRDIEGIERWQIYTNDVKEESRCMPSPDGNYLARIIDLGREHRRLRWPAPELRVYENATGKLVYLSPLSLTTYSPVWSSDSRSLAVDGEAFERNVDGTQGDQIPGPVRGEAWVETSTEELHEKLGLGYRGGTSRHAIWDPTGRYLAMTRTNIAEIFSVDGRRLRRLVTSNEDVVLNGVSWSASGDFLMGKARGMLVIWDTLSGDIVKEVESEHLRDACFHPIDDSKIALTGATPLIWNWKDDPDPYLDFLPKPDEPKMDRVLWSPDGTHLAYVHTQRHKPDTLTMVVPDGTIAFSRNDLGELSGLDWTPDGKFLTSHQGAWFQIDLEGRKMELAPKLGGQEYYIDWKGDGSLIAAGYRLYSDTIEPGPPIEQAWDHLYPYSSYPIPQFSPDGSLLATNCRIGTVIRDTKDFSIQRMIIRLPNQQYVTLSAAGEILASSPDAGQELVYLLEHQDGRLELESIDQFHERVSENYPSDPREGE